MADDYFLWMSLDLFIFAGVWFITPIVKYFSVCIETLAEIDDFVESLLGQFKPLYEYLLLPLEQEHELYELKYFIL